MKNPFKNSPLSIEELVKWKQNPLINPRSSKLISEKGSIYKAISKAYNSSKEQVDKYFKETVKTNEDPRKALVLKCNEDRDVISMNLFWIEEDGIRKIVYPEKNFDDLVFYTDNKKLVRCFEKDSIRYMKTYGIKNHPVSTEIIPEDIFEQVIKYDITEITELKTIENKALDVFQYFSKISIFIDHESFINLSKKQLIKFNYELRDFWLQNFTIEQRKQISSSGVFTKVEEDFIPESLEDIQKYLLSQMEILLKCEIEEYKYMINYIILGALGIVIPQIKEMYPDFLFSF